MQYAYDGQIKRYLTQFMRLMSNFSYKDASGNLKQIPVRYGNMNRQVAQILNKNSENTMQTAPFIACYIKNMEVARDRTQDPTYVGKMNIRERAVDEMGNEYLNIQGANYTIERIMPTPFNLTFVADIWTTNTDQKLQILEQMLVLFNPSIELQTTDNYIDWTSLTTLELKELTFSSRQIPQGVEQDVDIATLSFYTPIWITPPAKVKKLGIITKIIASIFEEPPGTAAGIPNANYDDTGEIEFFPGRNPISINVTTLGNMSVLILDNTAKLIKPKNIYSNLNNNSVNPPVNFGVNPTWINLLDYYPGKFIAGLSQIRLLKHDGNEIVGYLSLNPVDDSIMQINFDIDTVPLNTLLVDSNGLNPRGTVDAIVNPQTFDPRPLLPNRSLGWPVNDTRYLILDDLTQDTEAWKNQDNSYFHANSNDIIQWDGTKWNTIFNSLTASSPTYITNSRTGIQYVWNTESWTKSYEGIYDPGNWRLIL